MLLARLPGMEGEEVWVAETWGPYGEDMCVHGVYSSREAAWDGLKGYVDTLYIGEDGFLHGKPREEKGSRGYFGRQWALAQPMKVEGPKG